MKILKLIILLFVSSVVCVNAQLEDEDIAKQHLKQTIENDNPVYIPAPGVSIGLLNFYGEVKNKHQNPLNGTPAYKFNVATYVDNQHYFRGNFYVMTGSLQGSRSSLTDASLNQNFQTDMMAFGVNLHYDFRHWVKASPVRPFISFGFENIQFASKTDLFYQNGSTTSPYYYWSDGTIRNISESQKFLAPSKIITRDNSYETDLRKANLAGLGNYSQNTFGLPIEVGLDYSISERLNLRIGYALHYTFTDNLDNVSSKSKVAAFKGDAMNDMFSFTYFSLHWDLFSESKYIEYDLLLADADGYTNDLWFDDEDNDGVKDPLDRCPGTPEPGVNVDTAGCPVDTDGDGVPDYLDKEINTVPNAIVDDKGVIIDPSAMAERLRPEGIRRKDVEAYLQMLRAQSRTGGRPSKPIPAKFKGVDIDGDGYISFDELLIAINGFFDLSSEFSTKDIYELQDFFFEQ